MSAAPAGDADRDEELLADLFDRLLQDILEGRTPDLDALHPERPDLRDRIAKTWSLACSVAGRREPSRPVFGGYEILRELGHGGMGTVYLARHQTLQRDVAVKVLPQSLAMSPRAKQRFVEEARALAQLRHENVVHVHRIVDHSEMLAFEMEYVDGPSLQELLASLRQRPEPHSIEALAAAIGLPEQALGTRSTVEWFVRLAITTARALGEVHRHGLVHRDVKPANILLRNDGAPVLADFGLALHADLEPQSGKFAGTPAYAAPERLRADRGGAPYDASAASDVYSLGVTLYEALALEPPFPGSTTGDVLRRIEAGGSPDLRATAPHLSQDLATIVAKAMESEPRHRYATADELADDLERLLNFEPIHARPAGLLRRGAMFARRHRKAVLAGVTGALLVAAVSLPMTAFAAEREARAESARRERHAARQQLLCLESLPAWWLSANPGGEQVRATRLQEARVAALEAALERYDRALRATPDDRDLAREATAVRAAAANATRAERDPGAAPVDDAFGAGLYAFLTGDRMAHRSLWRRLPDALAEDPFVDACVALRLVAEGHTAQAYPRAFHAARAFPDATALVVAMADGALAAGDLDAARRWFSALPTGDGPAPLTSRRRLLEADLLAADGDLGEAERRYRAMVRDDHTDPRPLQHLADLYLQRSDLETAGRLFETILRRWPDFAAPRRALARVCLQRRDVPGYLAQVRYALDARAPDPAEIDELLRLGGLRRRDATVPAASLAAVPLQAFLTADQVAGIERALDVLPIVDGLARRAAAVDHRPIGRALVTAGLAAVRFPDATARLPMPLRAALGTIPWLQRYAVDRLSVHVLPYQRVLGNRLRRIGDQRVFDREISAGTAFYGRLVRNVGDVDGDTLPELAVTAPPAGGHVGTGYLELRRADDGALLSRWDDDGKDSMFACDLVTIGDVDGDQCNDLLVGKPMSGRDGRAPAAIELRSGRTGASIWQVEHERFAFGVVLCPLDDLDDDGVADFAVGAPPVVLTDAGVVELRSGRTGDLLRTLRASAAGTWFGAALAQVGDLDGDGHRDLLVGGNFGGAPGRVVVFAARSGSRLLDVQDDNPGTRFGATLAAVGDLDEDGVEDFAIGAPGDRAGAVRVVSGRTGNSLRELRGDHDGEGFGSTLLSLPSWRRSDEAALAVAAARGGPTGSGYVRVFALRTGAPLQTFAASSGHGMFGYGLVDLGDRDGDGLRDLGIMQFDGRRRAGLLVGSFADIDGPPIAPR